MPQCFKRPPLKMPSNEQRWGGLVWNKRLEGPHLQRGHTRCLQRRKWEVVMQTMTLLTSHTSRHGLVGLLSGRLALVVVGGLVGYRVVQPLSSAMSFV